MHVVDYIYHSGLHDKVVEKLDQLVKFANEKWPDHKFTRPTVEYSTRMKTTAGFARVRENKIILHPYLLCEYHLNFIRETVTHEFAHIVDFILHPNNFVRYYGQKCSYHGLTWKAIMRIFGQNPSRCHTYNVKEAVKNVKNRIKYCHPDDFANQGKIVRKVANEERKKSRKTNKLAQCRELYALYGNTFTRDEILATFRTRAGLTYRGALTYYYKIKKEQENT